MGGATDEVEVFEQWRADRGSKERWNHSVGGPAVKGAAHDGVAGLEIGRRKPLFVDDPPGKAGEELFVQDPDDPLGVGGGFFGPVDAFRFRRGVDEKEVVVVIGRGVDGLGARAEAEIDRGVFGRLLLPEHLLELERVVVREEDVVVG